LFCSRSWMSSTKWKFKENHKPLSSKSCKSSTKWWFKENQKPITLTFCCSIDKTLKLEAWLSNFYVVPPCQVQGEKTKKNPLQYVLILESEFVGMAEISSWLLMTIVKKSSDHNGSLLLQLSCVWNTYLKDDCVVHNAHKDEDWNTDLPCGQLTDNVGISESTLEPE